MPAEPDRKPPRQPDAEQPANSGQSPSFEAGLAQLADLVGKLEGGGLGLAESIEAYERGVALLGRLHAELADAEERVRVLLGIDEEGRPILRDGAPRAGDEAAAVDPGDDRPAARGGGGRSAARSTGGAAGRSPRTKSLPGMDGP